MSGCLGLCINMGSREITFGMGESPQWSGFLGDKINRYVGVQLVAGGMTHYGWVRFGNVIGLERYSFADAYIIEWAYETEPDTLVTISAPPNASDSFGGAAVLPTRHFKLWNDNSLATSEVADPNLDPQGAGATLWWKWTAPTNGLMWLASRSGPFDTVMGVYRGESFDALEVVVATQEGCIDGTFGLTTELEFDAEQDVSYFIMLDSRKMADGTAPTGEVHLEGSFSTVQLVRPHEGALRNPDYPIDFSVTNSVYDGELDYIEIEANGKIVAQGRRGEPLAHWFDTKPGPYRVRAVWYDSDGVARRSQFRDLHVRPLNSEFQWCPFVDEWKYSTRASNVYSTDEEGEPVAPPGTDLNSVWWRWYASESGVLTLNVPDGNGLMSIAVYEGLGPWAEGTNPIGHNPIHPSFSGRLMNHVQIPVTGNRYYALCVRSLKGTAGSWHGMGGCDPLCVNGREFIFQLDFTPGDAGRLLVHHSASEMLGTFAARVGRPFSLECSTNLFSWDEVEQGTTTGTMQLLRWPFDSGKPQEFFRLKVGE